MLIEKKILLFALVSLVLSGASAQAQSGSLKVTSFPSGARVSIDGTDTGKVTPMSISLAAGDHAVVVSIPNSGWNPDSRTITIVSGNNDLSVTLLPTLTTGPAGLKGDKGDKGDAGAKGEKGDPGAVLFAGQVCPAGTFVTGFSVSGTILCGAPGDEANQFPIPLPSAQAVQLFLESVVGNEFNHSTPFQYNIAGLGVLHGNVDTVGYAFCQPTSLGSSPNPVPPLFDCAPKITVTLLATSPNQASLTVSLDRLYIGLGGTWILDGPLPSSGSISAFGLYSNVIAQFAVPLTNAGGNQVRFGSLTRTDLQYQSANLSVDFGNAVLNSALNIAVPLVFSNVLNDIANGATLLLGNALVSIPPFTVP